MVVSERSARPVDESRPGKLIGCRHQPSNSIYLSGQSTWTGDLRTITVPPECPASRILRATFGQPDDLDLVEDWVNSVTGEEDRSKVYGKTAVERAKKRLQVRHYEDRDLAHYGELRLDGCQLKAFIRTGQHRGREMFTVAHELGHASLHLLDPEFDQRAEGTERLCDLFAVEMTMPAMLVHDIWDSAPDARAITRLARKTNCSLTASCIRIAEYNRNVTTGRAYANGYIIKHYGPIAARDLRIPVEQAYRKASEKKSSWAMSNGLAVHTRTVKKLSEGPDLVVFLARRIR